MQFEFILLINSCCGEVFLDYARRVCRDTHEHDGYTSFVAVIARLNETLYTFGLPVFFTLTPVSSGFAMAWKRQRVAHKQYNTLQAKQQYTSGERG